MIIKSSLDLDSMQRFNENWKSAKLFPNKQVLQVGVYSVTMTSYSMDILYHFPAQFNALRHFSLSGTCCCSVHQEATKHSTFTSYVCRSVQQRFNISNAQCSSHLSLDLMQMFPSLNRIILAEQPGRCRGGKSRARDWNYIKKLSSQPNFFRTFSLHAAICSTFMVAWSHNSQS